MKLELESFREAFFDSGGFGRYDCDCGKPFYNPDNDAGCFELGELDFLKHNGTPCYGGVRIITFNGTQYVQNCDCWHVEAKRLIQFFKGHGEGIAQFFEIEKARQIAAAEALPIIHVPAEVEKVDD